MLPYTPPQMMDNFLSERLWAPLLKLVPSEDIGKIVIDIIY